MYPTITRAVIIAPSYGEGSNVKELLHELDNVARDLPYEHRLSVLYVEDAPSDHPENTIPVLESLSGCFDYLEEVRWCQREGDDNWGRLGGAVVTGYDIAQQDGYDIAIVMDADLQHDPEIIPDVLKEMTSDRKRVGHLPCDLVVASRYIPGGDSGGLDGSYRHLVSRASTRFVKAVFPKRLQGITDPMSGFFAVNLRAIDIDALLDVSGFKIGLELEATHIRPWEKRRCMRVSEVPLRFRKRLAGDSKAGMKEGIALFKQTMRLRLRLWPSWMTFLLVGGATSAVNIALFEALVWGGINPIAANVSALFLTLLLNLRLNRRHTFKSSKKPRWQTPLFLASRCATLGLSWWTFTQLYAVGYHHHLANAAGLFVGLAVNYPLSKVILHEATRNRFKGIAAGKRSKHKVTVG